MYPIRCLSTFTFSFNVVLGCFLIFKMCFIKKLGQPHQHLAGDGSLVKDLSGFYAMVAPKEFMRGLHQKSGPISHPVGTWQVPGLSGPSGREAHQTPHTGQRGLTKIRLSEWGRWDISHIVHRWRPDSFCPLPLQTTDSLQTISVKRGWSPYVSEWVQIYLFEQNEQWIKHYLLLFGLWLKEHPFRMLYVPHLIIIIVLSECVLPDQHISFASYNFVFCTPIEWSCSTLFRWDGCTTWVLFGRYVSEVWLLPLSSLPLSGNKQRNFLLFFLSNQPKQCQPIPKADGWQGLCFSQPG